MAEKKNESQAFAIPRENYKFMLIGFAIVVIGYLLMIGGGSKSANEFNMEMFNFQRTTLAPLVVLLGYAFEIWAIMRNPKKA
jgi:hypothetical protein